MCVVYVYVSCLYVLSVYSYMCVCVRVCECVCVCVCLCVCSPACVPQACVKSAKFLKENNCNGKINFIFIR